MNSRLLLGALIALLFLTTPLQAATPSSGTVSRSGSTTASWSGGPFTGVTSSLLGARCNNSQCDSYTLTVGSINPGDQVTVHIDWINPANDFDLYIFDSNGTQVTSSTGGAPSTSEEATFSVAANKTYTVSVLIYTVVNDTYVAKATMQAGPVSRTPVYAAGNFTFSPNITLAAPYTFSDGEPSLRVDKQGNVYTAGIRGVPAGVDLWRTNSNSDPCAANWSYLGSPDAFRTPTGQQPGPADGGGDVDLNVGFPNDGSLPKLGLSSLAAANISFANSTDRGQSFFLNPAVATVADDDRQWQESYGKDTVFLFYRAPIPFTGLFVQKSIDAGRTFLPASFVDIGSTPGYISVDQNDGTVYVCYASSSALFVASSKNAIQWSTTTVANTSARHQFPVVKVDRAGNVYVVWSDGVNIFLSVSTNHAKTWSPPVQVNDPANVQTKTNVFPWMEAGDAGRLDIVWFGTDSVSVSSEVLDNNDWHVYFSQTLNALDANITFRQSRASDHIIHHGGISQSGLAVTGGPNRNLLDYFQVAIDPRGGAFISYTDDHNDFFGNMYVTRQTSGTSIRASSPNVPTVTGCTPPPFHTEPEVSDFAPDAQVSVVNVPADAVDIVNIDYGDETIGGQLYLIAKMKVLDLSTGLPPNVHWRSYLAFSHDIADKGKEYYMELSNDNGVPSFSYGTVARNHDGSYTETQVGTLDGSSFTQTKPGIVKLRILASKLTKPNGAAPAFGDTVVGTKGRTFISGMATTARFDRTRGGTAFIIGGGGGGNGIFVECDDGAMSMKGGWHEVRDDRASNGHYCRNVGANKSSSGASLEFQFRGSAVNVQLARGPRGGNAEIFIDGASRGKLNFYRAPSDPAHPDNSGKKDLTFGIIQRYPTTQGSHTFRMEVLNDDPDPLKDMVYVDGFVIESGDASGTGNPVDISTLSEGVVGILGLASQTIAATGGTQMLTAVLDLPNGGSVDVLMLGPNGNIVAQSSGSSATQVVQSVPTLQGVYTIKVVNKSLTDNPYSLYTIRTQTGSASKIVSQYTLELPDAFALYQNYPNPFNPTTIIRYALASNSYVRLKVYDILGQEVSSLVDEAQNSGTHAVTFDASRLSSGMYMYKLVASNGGSAFIDIKRMLIIK